MKSFVVVVVTVVALVAVIHVAHAGRVTVPVVSTAFQSHSPADTAPLSANISETLPPC